METLPATVNFKFIAKSQKNIRASSLNEALWHNLAIPENDFHLFCEPFA